MMLTESQLLERRLGIGGSDVAAILGLSPWKTELDVYLSKVGEFVPQKETKRQRRGSAIEPLILDRFRSEIGLDIEMLPTLQSETHPFMLANLDGRVPDTNEIVEAKASWSTDGWGESGTADVPAYYQTQVCHYFAVTGARRCYLPVLFGMDGLDWSPVETPNGRVWTPVIAEDADVRIFVIQRDESFVADVIEAERAFWHDHVLARVPPMPVNRDDALKLWTRDNGKAVDVSESISSKVSALKAIRAQLKELKERDEAIVDELAIAFGEAAVIKHAGSDLATYKHQKRKGYTVAEAEFRVLRLK